MGLESLQPRSFSTPLGPVTLSSLPGAFERRRPAVLVITNVFTDAEALTNTCTLADPFADGFVVRLPGGGNPLLARNSVHDYARALEVAIAEGLAGRPLILSGTSVGALVALAIRAPKICGIVAAEPPLATSRLWPLLGPLRGALRDNPGDPALAAMIREIYGVEATEVHERGYISLFDAPAAPVDLILGEIPLQPERPLERHPSFVDEAEREVLARNPVVTLHIAEGVGHAAPAQCPTLFLRLLAEACERAVRAGDDAVDEALLELTPLDARRLGYAGPGAAAFARAYQARNPGAAVVDLGEADDQPREAFDVVVAAATPSDDAMDRIAADLSADGVLVTHSGHLAAAHGLVPIAAGGSASSDVVRLSRSPRGEPLHVELCAYAVTLMDIRTRLPTLWLRSDPALTAGWRTVPFELPPLPRDLPKVAILQRPASFPRGSWLQFQANLAEKGWLLVLEVDDHPAPMLSLRGLEVTDFDWRQFGCFHAVQTSTPRLAAAFAPHNPEIAVFPNAAFDVLPFPEQPRPTRIFYGAVSRGAFGAQVAAALAPVIAQFPDVETVVVGDEQVFAALPGRKTYHPYASYEGYLRLMSACDISLAPIEDRPFMDTKSDAKFLDASRAGALTIASPTVYSEVVEHGVNGLIAATVEDWPAMLRRALEDAPGRRRLAKAAWDYVRRERMFAHQIPRRRDWYFDLWSRRAALQEALSDRMARWAEKEASEAS